MVATVIVRQAGRSDRPRVAAEPHFFSNDAPPETPASGREDQLLAGLYLAHAEAIDLEQSLLAHAETSRHLCEGVAGLHDVHLRTASTLVAHAKLVAGVNGRVGV